MSQIIAGIYEIKTKIGSGGGGDVYLGEHLRLEKKIVLKADKRMLRASKEVLRREVDLLKDLSHTYIPQVYDFVQEDGQVYTVMDFIDGESFDKILKKGVILTQPEIIKWACQLLEALKYLHSYPPYGILHGDIKPANIMLRPNGDICLIDFNIALTLGEEGAVKVGHSRGYASPEHYGESYAKEEGIKSSIQTLNREALQTEIDYDKTVLDSDRTVKDKKNLSLSLSPTRSTTDGKQIILLDVRSDIYSLGATLYHLISGRRPAQDALKVEPLDSKICNPEVSKIIQKAMAPKPSMRYQSAEEMLQEFRMLHKNDQRAVRHKRQKAFVSGLLGICFCAGVSCTFVGLKQLEKHQAALTLAEYSANSLEQGEITTAIRQVLKAIPEKKNIFDAPLAAEVQLALANAVGAYDMSDGYKDLDVLELPAAPYDIVLSPNEKYVAVVYAYEVSVYELETLKKIVVLPIQESALTDVVFVEETKIIYAGKEGVTAYDLEKMRIIWNGEIATNLAISEDKKVLAAVNRDESYAKIYCTLDGSEIATCDFATKHLAVAENDIFMDPEANIFTLNENGSMLAVSFSNGELIIFDLGNSENDLILCEKSEAGKFAGGFYGNYFAYTKNKSLNTVFEVVDIKNAVFVGKMETEDNLKLKVDSNGIYLAKNNLLVRFEPETQKQLELAYTENVNIVTFSIGKENVVVATDDQCFSFFDSAANLMSSKSCDEISDFVLINNQYSVIGNHNQPQIRVLKNEEYKEYQLLQYDSHYAHEEARVSQNKQTVMLFSNQGFQIYDIAGELICEIEIPDSDSIYDQQFRKEDKISYLEVVWYNGLKRCYSAEDGSVIREENIEKPSKNLYEEFYVDGYRIESELHSAPEVYDIKTNKLITTLEKDAYLTYVTEMKNYIITEYISAAGERYGILLNKKFEKLAYLPKLCDVVDGQLVFDYESGNLRQCRLYSIQELINLGMAKIDE